LDEESEDELEMDEAWSIIFFVF